MHVFLALLGLKTSCLGQTQMRLPQTWECSRRPQVAADASMDWIQRVPVLKNHGSSSDHLTVLLPPGLNIRVVFVFFSPPVVQHSFKTQLVILQAHGRGLELEIYGAPRPNKST